MQEKFNQLTEEYVKGIKSICDPLYVILYGSSRNGDIRSDMDMCTIVKEASKEIVDAVADFTIDFHRKHGLKEDYDVPYQSKTLYTYEDLENAVSAVSFIHRYDKFLIPPIIMRPDFLGSKEMKYRLLLNALTSNNRIVFGDEGGDIKDIEKKCWETIFRVILSQGGKGLKNEEEMYDRMVRSENKEEGKGYLGYMEKNRGDMVKKVSLFLAIFEKEGKIVKTEKGYQATQERMDELMTKNIEAKKKLMEQPPKYTDKKRIDFATNKNPFGPFATTTAEKLIDIIKEYPDYTNDGIDTDLSSFLGVDKECVSVCQGSLDAIYTIPQCIPFDDCLIVEPTYRGYAAAIQNMGRKHTSFSLDKDFDLDMEKLSEAIQEHSLVFLCNPNNPTGTYIPRDILLDLIRRHPTSHFVIDESHLLFNKEFDEISLKKDVEQISNLTVVMSLSKFFNIPGIRMGVVVSNPLMIDTFRAKNIPYYINGVSTKLLKDNLSEKNRISDTREKISDVKHDFYENLRTIPWLDIRYNEYNNFFMCHITDERISARKLERELLDKGIMIRMCEGINGDRIRISINTKENNDLLIAALNEPSLVERSMRKLF